MRELRNSSNQMIKQIHKPSYGFNGFVLFVPRENLPYHVYINCEALGHTKYDLRLVGKLIDQESSIIVLDGLYQLYRPFNRSVTPKLSKNKITLKSKKSKDTFGFSPNGSSKKISQKL